MHIHPRAVRITGEEKHRRIAVSPIIRMNQSLHLISMLRAKDGFYDSLIDGAGSSSFNGLQARVRALRVTWLGTDGRTIQAAHEVCALVAAVRRRDDERAEALCAGCPARLRVGAAQTGRHPPLP
jgi:DNA-binding GntR family transcriptional regulator